MKPKIDLDPVRGFRDILSPDSEMLTHLLNIFIETARLHGYNEIKPPTLERFEVFAVKSGEEIKRTMYVFRDKAGREVALRPEATASIARIYLKHLRHRPKPLRLYYTINCFRYEEPQYARYREFWQAGIELLGEPRIIGDIEVLKILIFYYNRLKFLDEIVFKVGSTKIYRKLFSKYNIEEDRQDLILHYMDKREYNKALDIIPLEHKKKLKDLLKKLWMEYRESPRDAYNLLLPINSEAAEAVRELETLVSALENYNASAKIKIDLSFARGLAYYTGIIFEAQASDFPVSIAGGGRYDTLIELYGGERVPGTGFAIGVDRTLLAMKERGKEPEIPTSDARIAIIVMINNDKAYSLALKIGDILASKKIITTTTFSTKMSKLIPKLLEQKYTHIILIGKRELEENKISLKDLRSKKQYMLTIEELEKNF